MGARRRARECALQMLFSYDVTHSSVEELIETYWGEMAEAAEDVRGFANELVIGTVSHLNEIDELIRLRTEHWRITRMAIVDRNLLRLAIFEFLYQPPKQMTIQIKEALANAERSSHRQEIQHINA